MSWTVLTVGTEGESVVVIDAALPAPEAAVDLAASLAPFPPVAGNYYPGARLILAPEHGPAAKTYVDATCVAALPALRSVFGIAGFEVVEASFSMVTTPPADTTPGQRVAHCDTSDPSRFAVLHYLCRPEHGGTGFFRHRVTGFERITPERHMLYSQALELDLEIYPPAPAYLHSSSPVFERIGAVDAAFNRMVIYRSALLHSGLIPDDFACVADPRTGRLTGNLFLRGR